MKFPEFTVIRASTFYIHRDPYTFVTDQGSLNPHISDCYYFDFFYKDLEGGIEIDGTFYQATKNCFSLAKPQQRRRIVMPISSYFLRITVEDAELKASLDSLPSFGFHPEMAQIIDLCKNITSVSNTSSLDGRLHTQILAASILRLMLKYNPEPANAIKAIPRRHQPALDSANKYLREHLDENVDLAKLAKESGLYPTYFHKLFKDAYGRTPSQQLMWHRLEKAFFLLQDDNCPIVEVAQQCGFSSHSYFCYKFKEMWGATPTEYRQRHRSSRENQ